MSDNHSNNPARDDLDQTLACVGRITREFDGMTARLRMDNAEIAVLTGELRQLGNRSPANPGSAALPAAFQEIDQWLARQKALGKELIEAAATFAQELIHWAEELEEGTMRADNSVPTAAQTMATVSGNSEMPSNSGQGSISIAREQNAATEDMMRIDPPIASDPISESLTLANMAGIPAMVEGLGGLVAAGTREMAGFASEMVGGLTKAVERRLAVTPTAEAAPVSFSQGLNQADFTFTNNVANVDISFIENEIGGLKSFVQNGKAFAIQNGADTMVVNTGHIVNDDLIISLGKAAQTGKTIFGGTVEITTQIGTRPQFTITIPLK